MPLVKFINIMGNTLAKANAILGTNYNNWMSLSKYEGLTEDFIREFADKVNWETISLWQTLSEDFIKEYKDKVNWNYISYHQKLSKPFIRVFSDRVDWNSLRNNPNFRSINLDSLYANYLASKADFAALGRKAGAAAVKEQPVQPQKAEKTDTQPNTQSKSRKR